MGEFESVVQLLITYGPMGVCLWYFITKDKQNQEQNIKKQEEAIKKQEETNQLVIKLADAIIELKNSFNYYLKEIKEEKKCED